MRQSTCGVAENTKKMARFERGRVCVNGCEMFRGSRPPLVLVTAKCEMGPRENTNAGRTDRKKTDKDRNKLIAGETLQDRLRGS